MIHGPRMAGNPCLKDCGKSSALWQTAPCPQGRGLGDTGAGLERRKVLTVTGCSLAAAAPTGAPRSLPAVAVLLGCI